MDSNVVYLLNTEEFTQEIKLCSKYDSVEFLSDDSEPPTFFAHHGENIIGTLDCVESSQGRIEELEPELIPPKVGITFTHCLVDLMASADSKKENNSNSTANSSAVPELMIKKERD